MKHRRDHDLIERLRSRDLMAAELDDDPLLAGLLALSLEADVVAPSTPVRRTPAPTRRPLLAGLATTALAGAALVFTGVAAPSAQSPGTTPTASADSVAVTELLDSATADLDKLAVAPTASKAPLLAHAAAALRQAEARAKGVPSDTERRQLDASAALLQERLASSQKAQSPQAKSAPPNGRTQPTGQGQPNATPTSTSPGPPNRAPAPGTSPVPRSAGGTGSGSETSTGQLPPPPGSGQGQVPRPPAGSVQ